MSFTNKPAEAGQTDILATTEHRPWPLPAGKWAIKMRWTDLLFAHWPVPEDQIARLIPSGFAVDTYDGSAWVGVVPFRMERVQLRGFPRLPGTHLFTEANVRTYVRDRKSGQHGVYFFSLDASNPLAVMVARGWYHLPYYFARMRIRREGQAGKEWLDYSSRRLFSGHARLQVRYRGIGLKAGGNTKSKPGTMEYFLTERYALFTGSKRGRLMRADVHHLPWPLEPAEAEFGDVTVAAAQSITLPAIAPKLQYARSLEVFAWAPRVIA